MRTLRYLLALAITCLILTPFSKADIVTNGDLELGTFHQSGFNYDILNAASTDLNGWTVVQQVAWGVSPTDGFHAADGVAFVDLSSFGHSSPTGEIDQMLTLTTGHNYTFTFDSMGSLAGVFIGGQQLTLTQTGTELGFGVFSGTFTATSDGELLRIVNVVNNDIVFVDDIAVTEQSTATPEPASLLLVGPTLLGLARFRQRRRQAGFAHIPQL